ncbi:hypothetical protein LAG90_11125 [Marinilongibacter aquaticus]|uniref:hypothetical protein n=1 Tax=Marinilongibacter aquaticus TaxID=2975157 RepID=UPI0021BD849F|nr:hypothetical protein [Marinilongibacter aquaticus]UBM57370.1 hypothetical protein LAG90_11125 [Marinilongibacter aquaticus]
MRRQKHILFAFRLFLGLLMVGTFLSKGMAEQHVRIEKSADSDGKKDQDQASFDQYTSSYVIPSVAFHFEGDFVWLIDFDLAPVWVEQICRTFTKPIYRLSFFEKLFEHHIAINAP